LATLNQLRKRGPPAAFHFAVTLDGVNGTGEGAFSEVSGLDAERGVLEIAEGGENRFLHRVPERAKYGNLVLKRGVLLGAAGLARWCMTVLEGDLGQKIQTKTVVVQLLDAEGGTLQSWNFADAWPIKWSVAALAADKSELAVETLELAYSSFTRSYVPNT
jgi:phage tail-like protein